MKKLLLILVLFTPLSLFSQTDKTNSAFLDFLYWRASQQTSSTWASVISITDKLAVRDFNAMNVQLDWRSGYKAGFKLSPSDFWNTTLYWTYFSTKSKESITAQPGNIILPEFFNGFTSGNFFFGANLAWRLKMNMIDLEISHKFNPLESLSIRPSLGVKGGTINQTINSQWNAAFFIATEKLKNNFAGIGPSFGIDSEWSIYKNLNLVGNFSTALMWGRWDIEDAYTRPGALFGLIQPTTISSKISNSMLGSTMFRYFMGLEWVHKGASSVTIKGGYEMQFWNNQLRLPTFQELPLRGDLTFQGGVCSILIDL